MQLRSSCEHPNRNRLHVQLASPDSFRGLAEDVSKLPKFPSVLSALRQSQNSSAFIHLAVLQHTSFSKIRSEEHTSELQSLRHLVCRLLLEKKNNDKFIL